MADTAFQVRVPSALLQFGIDQQEIERRVNEWLVLSLFTDGQLSSGKAARILNISLRARGIAYINYIPEELADEIATVNTLLNASHE